MINAETAENVRAARIMESFDMRKMFRILETLMLCSLLFLGAFIPVKAEGEDFDAFMEEEAVKRLAAEYIDFHFNVIDCEKFDLPKPEVKMPDISYEAFAEEAAELQESLDRLHTFDYESLDERQQHDYLAYEDYLTSTIALDRFPDYKECYNPHNGEYENMITNITEFSLYDRESADDYLTLMEDFPRMLGDMDEFTKQQAAKGHFMPDALLDEALESMQVFIDKGDENPLIVIYSNNIDKLEELSAEEKASYKEKNRELVVNRVFPALQKTRDVLESLRGSRSVSGSVYEYEDGRAYYEALADERCSSYDSLDEKRDYLAKCVKDFFAYLVRHIGNPLAKIKGLESPEAVLTYLNGHMEDFPEGPELNYTLSYLDPCVANPSVVAYYLPPVLDSVTNNVIRINGDNVKDDPNMLYMTLSHEGLPGHMYQFTWYYSQPDTTRLRHAINSIGYCEGWAQYVSRIMLLNSSLEEADADYIAINSLVGYTLQAYIDVLVNGYGYDAEALKADLNTLGINNMDEELNKIVEIVAGTPGQILPYGYGECRMWELHERVRGSLGEAFDPKEFHLQILKYGPRSYEVVESDLQHYVEGKGAEFKKEFTLFEYSATEKGASSIMMFFKKYYWVVIGGIILAAALGIFLLFLIIRGIIRLFTGKKKK